MNISVGNMHYHNFLATIQVNRTKIYVKIMPYGIFLIINKKSFEFGALIVL